MSTDRSLPNRPSRPALQSSLQLALAILAASALTNSAQAQGYYDPAQQSAYYYYSSPPPEYTAPQRSSKSSLRNYNERTRQSRAQQPPRSSSVERSAVPQREQTNPPASANPGYEPAAAYSFPGSTSRVPGVQTEQAWATPAPNPEVAGPTWEEIAGAQKKLQQLGYAPGSADGVLGRRTQEALREFQRAQAIEEEEALGPRTREALAKVSGQSPASSVIEKTVIGKLMNYNKSRPPTAVVPAAPTAPDSSSAAPAVGSPPPAAASAD